MGRPLLFRADGPVVGRGQRGPVAPPGLERGGPPSDAGRWRCRARRPPPWAWPCSPSPRCRRAAPRAQPRSRVDAPSLAAARTWATRPDWRAPPVVITEDEQIPGRPRTGSPTTSASCWWASPAPCRSTLSALADLGIDDVLPRHRGSGAVAGAARSLVRGGRPTPAAARDAVPGHPVPLVHPCIARITIIFYVFVTVAGPLAACWCVRLAGGAWCPRTQPPNISD